MADVITRLKVDSSDYDNKLKRAISTLNQSAEATKRAGLSFKNASPDAVKLAQAMGNLNTVSTTAKGKLNELKNAYSELAVRYRQLTDEEKKSPFGKAMADSCDKLKGRINGLEKDMNAVNKSLSGNGAVGKFKDLASSLGVNSSILTALTSTTALYTAGATALAAGVKKATEEFIAYNEELEKADTFTSTVTGLSGDAANAVTDNAKAMSKVWGVDFKDTVNGVNTLMQQFGISSEEALDITAKGLKGMTEGDGAKMLQMIQQYAPAFNDAGISASELVAIIQNTEGGLFTDADMSAIQMGVKNIRLMKDTTKDALRSIGVDVNDMQKKLNDGSMTTSEALKIVSQHLMNVGTSSQQAGDVLQNIFGKNGAAAGTKVAEAIANLNTNLDEMSNQTGAAGDRMQDLYDATSNLEEAKRAAFSCEDVIEFENELKVGVLNGAAGLINVFAQLKDEISGAFGSEINEAIGLVDDAIAVMLSGVIAKLNTLKNAIEGIVNLKNKLTNGDVDPKRTASNIVNGVGDAISAVNGMQSLTAATLGAVSKSVTPQNRNSSVTARSGSSTRSGGGSQKEVKMKGVPGSFSVLDTLGLSGYADAVAAKNGNAWNAKQSELSSLYSQFDNSTDASQKIMLTGSIDAINMDLSNMETPDGFRIGDDGSIIVPLELEADNDSLKDASKQLRKNLKITTDQAEAAKDNKETWNKTLGVLSQVGGVMQNMGNKGLNIAGTIMQAIANIALGFAAADAHEGQSGNIWEWIAASVAGLATMVATISTIKSSTKMAEGGILGGSTLSGDKIPFMGNAGEMVINTADQQTLFNAIKSGNIGMGDTYNTNGYGVRVTGESLYTVLDNHMRRTGKKLPA